MNLRFCYSSVLVGAMFVLGLTLGSGVAAGQIDKTLDFELDHWWEFEEKVGDVTVHRVRIHPQKQNVKSKLFRPGNAEYLQTIVIEMEFTNEGSRSVEADVFIEWLDSSGKTIDGYNDEEDFDDDERHEIQTVTLSTLKYGLEVAKKVKIKLDW